MNEQAIRAGYRALQEEITASDELKQKTLTQAREARDPALDSGASDTSSQTERRAPSRSHALWQRVSIAAAACLAVFALSVGIAVLSPGNTTGKPGSLPEGGTLSAGDQGDKPAVAPFDFSIQAYAAGADQVFSTSVDGTFFFESSMMLEGGFPGDAESIREWGLYTWCIFSVKGEGITRLNVETSKGELYEYTHVQLAGDEDPDFIKAAKAWKPTHGPLIGLYDNVNVRVPLNYTEIVNLIAVDEDAGYALLYSSETLYDIDLMKRLGPTADVTVDAGSGQEAEDYHFGLWTNEGSPDPFSNLDGFAGQTLTVTAWYADGHNSTLVIELQPVYIKCLPVMGTASDGSQRQLGYEMTPEVVDRENLSDEELAAIGADGYLIIRTLSGTVIEKRSEKAPPAS